MKAVIFVLLYILRVYVDNGSLYINISALNWIQHVSNLKLVV